MGRFTTLIGALALAVAACGGAASPSVTTAPPAPATPEPAASTAAVAPTVAPATPAPTPTAEVIAVRVTFDGTTCTYAGPSTVPVGSTLEWTFDNTPLPAEGYGAALVVAPVVDGTTWEYLLGDVQPQSEVPGWLKLPGVAMNGEAEIAVLFDDSAAAGRTLKTTLVRPAYYIGCGTNPDSGDKAFPALLLKTMKG